MDDAVQLPLRVDFVFATQSEAAQAALLGVAEHRLDQTHAMGVDGTTFVTVDFLAHRAAMGVGQFAFHAAVEEGELTWRVKSGSRKRWLRSGHASQRARFANSGGPFEYGRFASGDDRVGAAEFEGLVCVHTQVPDSRSKVKSLGL